MITQRPKKKAYAAAGVDVDLGNRVKSGIQALVKGTHGPEVLGSIGGFGGLFRPDFKGMRDPVLVSSADGVGTKLKLAFLSGRHDTVGHVTAWDRAEFGLHFKNSMIITIPAVLLTLLLASMMAFVLARFSYRFNLTLLGVFLAANLLPPQALLVPMFKIYERIPLPLVMSDTELLLGSFWGLIIINVAFQLGFCTFVLSNYMKTIPHEIYESAQMDGASVFRQYWQLTMPLVRPALAALGTLQFTWIYNEFFWATVLLGGRGEKFPITSSLNNLRGQFFSDTNLVAAGSILVALPVLLVFFLLQKQFVSGLTLGATKG